MIITRYVVGVTLCVTLEASYTNIKYTNKMIGQNGVFIALGREGRNVFSVSEAFEIMTYLILAELCGYSLFSVGTQNE